MTPIYGAAIRHTPGTAVVPACAIFGVSGTGWHDPLVPAVPLFEAFFRENRSGGTSGTTARLFAKLLGDVGND